MLFLRWSLALIISALFFALLVYYRRTVVLELPEFKKNYGYEELEENYKSRYLMLKVLMMVLIVINSFIVFVGFQIVSSKLFLAADIIYSVRSEYWILPSVAVSVPSSVLLAKKIFKVILLGEYEELVIYIFARKGCLSIKSMILKNIYKNVVYKIVCRFLICIFFIYVVFGFSYFSEFGNDRIQLNEYNTLIQKNYKYDDVAYIIEKFAWDGHRFIIVFKDGEKWSSKNILYNITSQDDYKYMKKIEERSGIKSIELK
ncbi:hypothetical protein [Clostridium sp. 'White wine YQ']|uniref:hypothetical protein n=1 Tax=Clostridium sp. 'White wine YQ' TaxID=3027474 RepID=UPI002366A24A|nr:hypothetical protein [Clostridium sp. 'White wine YQ']MDD7795829.1 hypothetical protein [Clostridium sp. 'White wine YQ']